KKKISDIPKNPLGKIDTIKRLFKKNRDFIKTIEFYEMLRKIEELKKERVGEFRKNVTLKVFYKSEEIDINLEALKNYAKSIEKFISTVEQFVLS
ncbi:MAG: hypothetical protein QXU40_02105, partial [Candidatus Pacearchaeota archaeon]